MVSVGSWVAGLVLASTSQALVLERPDLSSLDWRGTGAILLLWVGDLSRVSSMLWVCHRWVMMVWRAQFENVMKRR